MNIPIKTAIIAYLVPFISFSAANTSLLTVNAGSTDDFSYDEYFFNDEKFMIITAYNGTDADIVIPESIDGVQLAGIGDEVFKNNDTIRSVTIPESFSFLGQSVFENSSVVSVNIPENMYSIPLWTFAGCRNLTEVKMHDDIMAIDYLAFQGSSYVLPQKYEDKLTSESKGSIPNTYYGLLTSDGDWECIFMPSGKNMQIRGYTGSDTDIVFPETILGFPVTEINTGSSLPQGTTSLCVPESVKNVKSFFDKNLYQLKSLTVKGDETKIKCLFDSNKSIEELSIPRLTYSSNINNSSYIKANNCPNLKKVTFTGNYDTLEIIKEQFTDCPSLNELVFPGNCNNINIGYQAFGGCGFETLVIPYDCTLQNYSFQNNKQLTDITFDGKADIEGMSFKLCDSLKNVTFVKGGNVQSSAFENLQSLENVNISDDLTFSPKAFSGCSNLMNINSEPAFDSKTGDFNSKYKDFILQNFNGAQDVGFINEYIKANVKRIVSEVTDESMTDVTKAKALHDWLCANTEYDHNDKDYDKNHVDASVLLNDKTVCEGYANIYDLLLNEAGIESYYVHSSSHAWNIVNIDGHYFHIDTTWDDLTESYKWFLSSDSEMQSEGGSHGSWKLLSTSSLHVYDRTTAPECEYRIGDINTDGELNVSDLVGMSKYLHGTARPEKDNSVFYDMDNSGNIDVFDMIMLRKSLTE